MIRPSTRLRTALFVSLFLVVPLWWAPVATAQPAATSAQNQRRPVPDEPQRPAGPNAMPGGQRRTPLPDTVQEVRDIVYAVIERQGAEPMQLTMNVMFLKDNNNKPMPAILFIHGGGYSAGNKDAGNDMLLPLALGGYFAATIDYRLSHVAPYPAAVHDCKAAVRFLRANAEELGIDPDHIGVWGHSAGGHLAALLDVTGNETTLDGNVGATGVSSAVQCAVDMSGPVDFTAFDPQQPVYKQIIEQWFAGPQETLHDRMVQAGPIAHVDGDDPPLMIVHGADDNVVPIQHSEQLRDALRKAGVELQYVALENTGHGLPHRRIFGDVAKFFDKYLGGHAADVPRSGGARSQGRGRGRRPVPTEPGNPSGAGAPSGENQPPAPPKANNEPG